MIRFQSFTAILALSLLFGCATPPPATSGGFEFREGDHVTLLGNGLAERMQHHGWLETVLQSRFPGKALSFRNLGFSADELSVQQRTAGFGSSDDHLTRCGTDVLFAFFGFNESFSGRQGLKKFRKDLDHFVRHTLEQKYNGRGAPRLVLFSSIPVEDHGSPDLPDGREHNARITLYNRAIAEAAAAHHIPFVDLFGPMRALYSTCKLPLTINGMRRCEGMFRPWPRPWEPPWSAETITSQSSLR